MLNAPTDNELPDFTKANCRGKPVDWWYPTEHLDRDARQRIATAIAICRDCCIRLDCLEYSLKWEPVGIWGGFPESERHRLRKERDIFCSRPVGGVRTSRKQVNVNE